MPKLEISHRLFMGALSLHVCVQLTDSEWYQNATRQELGKPTVLVRSAQLLSCIIIAARRTMRIIMGSEEQGDKELHSMAKREFRNTTVSVVSASNKRTIVSGVTTAEFMHQFHTNGSRSKAWTKHRGAFNVHVEFVQVLPATSKTGGWHDYNVARAGMRTMRDAQQLLFDQSAADACDNDLQSDAAMTRLRRMGMREGENGRAVAVRVGGVAVANFRPIRKIRADQAAEFLKFGIKPDCLLLSDGALVTMMSSHDYEQEPKDSSMRHIGFVSDFASWVALMLMVAERRGQLAPGLTLRRADDDDDDGGFLGVFPGLARVGWGDEFAGGPQPTMQYVEWFYDPTCTLLRREFMFALPVIMAKAKEYTLVSFLEGRPPMSEIHVPFKPYNTHLTLIAPLSAFQFDHKAAASVCGCPGSGGDCRVESLGSGIKIGLTDDEWTMQKIGLAYLEDHTVAHVHTLFACFNELVAVVEHPEALFAGKGGLAAIHLYCGRYDVDIAARISKADALQVVAASWPATTPARLAALMLDGTISQTRVEGIKARNFKELGKNAFPVFSARNKLTWDITIMPLIRALAWRDASAEDLVMTLLVVDHVLVRPSQRFFGRSGLGPDCVYADVTATFLKHSPDQRQLLIWVPFDHNNTYLAKLLVKKVMLGDKLHDRLREKMRLAGCSEADMKKDILEGMNCKNLDGAYGRQYRHAFKDAEHTFRRAPASIAMLAVMMAMNFRHCRRGGRPQLDQRDPEAHSNVRVVPLGTLVRTSPVRTLDNCEQSLQNGVACAIPMAIAANTDLKAATTNNYIASMRAALPFAEFDMLDRRRAVAAINRIKLELASGPRASREAMDNLDLLMVETKAPDALDALRHCRAGGDPDESMRRLRQQLPSSAMSDYYGEGNNPHYSQWMRQHRAYNTEGLRRAKRAKAQKSMRVANNKLGRLLQKQGKYNTQPIGSLSNSLLLCPCVVQFECSVGSHRRKTGRCDAAFVRNVKDAEAEQVDSSEEEQEADDGDPNGDGVETRPLDEAVLDELECRWDDEDNGVLPEGVTLRKEQFLQCERCRRWEPVSHEVLVANKDKTFFCGSECRDGLREGDRPTSESTCHNEWRAARHYDKAHMTFGGDHLHKDKVEQQRENVNARVRLVRHRVGAKYVRDFSTRTSTCALFGQAAVAAHAIPQLHELVAGLVAGRSQGRARVACTLEPGTYVVTLTDPDPRDPAPKPSAATYSVHVGVDKTARVKQAAVGEEFVGLHVEAPRSEWIGLRLGVPDACFVAEHLKTNGCRVFCACLRGALTKHAECPFCAGLDLSKMPVGVDVPHSLPATGEAWQLDALLKRSVDGCCESLLFVALGKADDADLDADVTGKAVYEELGAQSEEWLKYIRLPGEAVAVGIERMDKHLLQWLRSREELGEGRWGQCKKPRLLKELQTQWDLDALCPFFQGQRVEARWLTAGTQRLCRKFKGWYPATVTDCISGNKKCALTYDDTTEAPGVPHRFMRRMVPPTPPPAAAGAGAGAGGAAASAVP